MLERLSRGELKEVRRIVLRHFSSAKKFRKQGARKDLVYGNLDSLARAVTGRRLPYVYLVWRNQRFRDRPELQLPLESSLELDPIKR